MQRCLFIILSCFAIVNAQYQNYPEYQLNVNGGDKGVDEILDKSLYLSTYYQIQDVEDDIHSRMIGEIHIGAGFDANSSSGTVGQFSIRATPFVPKMPANKKALAKIHLVRSMAGIRERGLTSTENQYLDSLEKQILNYNKKRWLHFSVGLSFSMEMEYFEIIEVMHPGLTLGYDIAEFGTISLGISSFRDPAFTIGYSYDISTPVYSMASFFFDHLRNKSPSKISSKPTLY